MRELISNASDAIDKLYFKSLTDQSVQMNRDDFKIDVSIDKANRLLKVCDNGIGMTEEELDKNLGTIAKAARYSLPMKTKPANTTWISSASSASAFTRRLWSRTASRL